MFLENYQNLKNTIKTDTAIFLLQCAAEKKNMKKNKHVEALLYIK